VTVEVRGYVLSPDQSIAETAIGYAARIFSAPGRGRALLPGVLRPAEPRRPPATGHADVWVVARRLGRHRALHLAGDPMDCARLVDRYDLGSASTFLPVARTGIAGQSGAGVYSANQGPLIMMARRVSRLVVPYDLSAGPDTAYAAWLNKAIQRLSDLSQLD
jgi:hypothetical protein